MQSNSYGSYSSSFKFTAPALPPTATCDTTANFGNVVSTTRRSLRLVCPGGCLAEGGSLYGTGGLQLSAGMRPFRAASKLPTNGCIGAMDGPPVG